MDLVERAGTGTWPTPAGQSSHSAADDASRHLLPSRAQVEAEDAVTKEKGDCSGVHLFPGVESSFHMSFDGDQMKDLT